MTVMAATTQALGVRMYRDEGCGIKVYEPRPWISGDPFRATYTEGRRRRYLQAVTEEGMAAKVERVRERLATGAERLGLPGSALIEHYLSPDRHPVGRQWSRKHADTQRRLCERFMAPVIAGVNCQDICESDMQQIVNAAPTKGEGARLRRCLRAMVNAGARRGYLVNSTLWDVTWQPQGRPAPDERAVVQGEAAQWVDPAEIPSDSEVTKLAHVLSAGRRGELDELMAYTAAYSGLRQGEQFALTVDQIAPADCERTITVDRKVVEISGKLHVEAPKMRKYRKTAYPVLTPDGYPLAEKIAARVETVRAEMAAGTNPLGLMFPSPRGTYWRTSNFDRRILSPAYEDAGWRDTARSHKWTWHSLRHVFCTTALFTWKMDVRDVAQMAGHANPRVTTDMYVGTTAGVLERARLATVAN